MTIEEAPKHAVNIAAAAAAPISYLSGVSEVVTIAVGIISGIYFVCMLWKLFFPPHFARFVRKINGEKDA